MTLRGPALFCSLGLLWLFAGLAKASDPKVPKLVWAHYVGWGFDFRKFYENPVQHYLRLQDRPLLGPWVDTDIGASSTVRLEMECALRYGVNGFAVDILKVQAYRHAMRRFYQGAEGLPFYVALCVDGWGNASMEEVVDALTAYFEEWGDHPNNFYIDGKPVVFIYKVGRPLADCREIVQRVRGRGFDAYWLVQPERETTLWENEPRMDEALSIFDGLYDFGINGFSVEEMKRRLVNGRRGLMKSRPGGLLVAGITPGYVGSKNAFYRPAYGTRTLRDNWAAAIFAAADWVCLTTWNDFWENTQFVPSEWNRDSLLRVNQIHSRRWRGEEQVPAPPDAILSYKPEVRLGDPWEVEVLGLPHIGGKATCAVELLDETGATMRRLPDVEMAGEGSVTVRHLPPSDLESHRLLRLRVAIVPKGSKVRREDWRELYPVAIRVGTMRKVQTIRFPVSAITEKVTISREGSSVLARIQSPNWVGEAALLRNGEVVERIPVAHSGGRMGNVSFDLGHISAQLPVDDFVVRFTRADGRLGFSPPIRVESQKQSSVFATKVAWRPLAMDVAWGNAAARCAGVRTVSLPREDVYGFRFEFNDPVADAPRDDFGWHVASMGGGAKWGSSEDGAKPQALREMRSDGRVRYFYRFDGTRSRVTLAPRSFPHDLVTCEVVLRVADQNTGGTILSDQNKAFDFGLSEHGRPYLKRGEVEIESKVPIPVGEWCHLAAVFDGYRLAIFLNGKEVASNPCPLDIYSINSITAIGCRIKEYFVLSNFFAGDIDALSVVATALSPDRFQLNTPDYGVGFRSAGWSSSHGDESL